MVYKDGYKEVEKLENGGARYMVDGVFTPEAEDGTDYRAVLDNYVSVGTVMNVGNI
jgi:5'-nucleotidase